MSEFKGTKGPWGVSANTSVDSELGGFICEAYGDSTSFEEDQANAKLIAAAPELLEALQWALPLAKIAMDTHRMERIKCGHMDINGTYKNGETWVGIYQKEVDEIESAQAAIAKALGG